MAELRSIHPLEEGKAASNGSINDDTHVAVISNSKQQSVSMTPLTQPTEEQRPITVYKNLIVVSVAFLFNFTAFQSLSNLQSTLNLEAGLGVAGLSVIYSGLVLSCLFLPPIIIKRFGCKWTVAFSFVPYILYSAANFYPHWGTIIPASFLLGLAGAPLWSAKCTYLTETGLSYSESTKETADAVVNRFFGIFFMIFQSGQIWGNLISSFVLQTPPGVNDTQTLSEEQRMKCGPGFCPGYTPPNSTNLERPSDEKIYTLCGIYVASGCVAVLIIILFLDQLKRRSDSSTQQGKHGKDGSKFKFSFDLLIATIKHVYKHANQMLLIPLTFYSGLEQGFLASDYTLAYVSCTMGIWMVGFVMICFGVTNALCSLGFGRVVKYTGRIPVFIFAAVTHFALHITLLMWYPDPGMVAVFFVISGLWGMGDAVWQTQINALYGCIFPQDSEAAFANYRLWESLGFILAFAYGNAICVTVKLYILMAVLIVGMIGYICVEIRERKPGKK